MDHSYNIDFIGIGYAKSGTSYIYNQLNAHKELGMPVIKELRYLNESWFMPEGTLKNKLFSSHFHYAQYRQVLKSRVIYWLKHPTHFKNDLWYRRYLLGIRSDAWYNGLFDTEKISGELTPAYTFMPEENVKDLSERFPQLKIVLMLRHPVARTWSHVKMNLAKHQGRKTAELSKNEITNRLEEVLAISPLYSTTIPLWNKYFDDVFIGFHEDIITRPEGLLTDLLGFLGAKDLSLSGLPLGEKINVGVKGDIPDWVEERLYAHFREDIKRLQDNFDLPYVSDWR